MDRHDFCQLLREAAKFAEREANAKAESVPDQWVAGQEHAYTNAMREFLNRAAEAERKEGGK